MIKFYHGYQFAAPVIVFPLAYWLWLDRFDGNYAITSLIMFVPVVAYYVIVLVGVVRLRLWKMNTRPTIRGVRPHHGFVIGAAAGVLGYVSMQMVPAEQGGVWGIVSAAFVLGSVFGFWNWWYETYAVKTGFISLYTKRIAEGATPEEAVTDYAPIVFGSFGACHGVFIKSAENLLATSYSASQYWSIAIAGTVTLIAVPAILYVVTHQIRYGDSGLESYIDTIRRHRETDD